MSEHGHSHGHGTESKVPPKPKTESEKALRFDMPVPKRKFMDKVRGLFRSTEEPNLEEINLFKHELVDNKKNLLAEIDKTIKGEVNLVVENIEQQIKIVQGMLEHNLLNATETADLLNKLHDKKTEAQKTSAVVIGELSKIDPDFQTLSETKDKQKKQKKTYKRASEIFAAIQKGELMFADDLTPEEKQLIINTLSEKYKAFSYSYQPEKKHLIYNPYRDDDDIDETNDKKIDSEREYEFYLELANRIGFDGKLDSTPKKKPETYTMMITGQKRKKTPTEGGPEGKLHSKNDNPTQPTDGHFDPHKDKPGHDNDGTERPSGPVGLPSNRLNSGGGGYLGKQKSRAKLTVIDGGLSDPTNPTKVKTGEAPTTEPSVDQKLTSTEFVNYKENTINQAHDLVKKFLTGKIKENDLIDGLDALYPPEAGQNLPEEKRQQMLEEFSEITQQVIDKLIAENRINSATKITKVFKPEKIAAIKKLDKEQKTETAMTPEQAQAELDSYLEGATQKADQLVMDLKKGFIKDEQFYDSLIELFPDPENKKILPEQLQVMTAGLDNLIKTKLMPDLVKIGKQKLAEHIAVALFGNKAQPGEINTADKIKILEELIDSALINLTKELESGTINADEFYNSLVDAQPTKENYGEEWEEIDDSFVYLLEKKVMPKLIKIGQVDLAKKIGEELRPEISLDELPAANSDIEVNRLKTTVNPDKTAVDLKPLFDGEEEIPIIDNSELIEVDSQQPEKSRRQQQAEELVDYLKSQKITGPEIAKVVKEILFDNIEVLTENPDSILGYVIADYLKQGDLETAKQLAELGSNKTTQEMTKSDLISYMLRENIIQTKSEFKQYLDSISNEAVKHIILKENSVKISDLKNDTEDKAKKVA